MHPFGCWGRHVWGLPFKPPAEQRHLGIPPKRRATSSLLLVTCAEEGGSAPPCRPSGGLCRYLSVLDGTGCHISMCVCVPPKQGSLQKVLSLREDTETDGAGNRRASREEGGRTAELCSRTTCSCVMLFKETLLQGLTHWRLIERGGGGHREGETEQEGPWGAASTTAPALPRAAGLGPNMHSVLAQSLAEQGSVLQIHTRQPNKKERVIKKIPNSLL